MPNRKWIPIVLVAVLALVVFLLRKCPSTTKERAQTGETDTAQRRDPASAAVNRDRGFDRRVSFLTYSRHALCRMDCREISREEVEAVMREGKINYNKSDIKNARCPRYAVESRTQDGQRVRIIYAQCNSSTAVVTVIDLEHDHACSCPGDDDKYINKK